MDTNSDASFAIGKTHAVCEDYATAGRQENGIPYAILCDGCSSSPDTDIGARLLAASAAFHMNFTQTGRGFKEIEILETAGQAVYEVNLDPRCLDSTLLMAWLETDRGESEEGVLGVRVRVRGDGVVAARRRDGAFVFHVVDHPKGAPLYLNYEADPQRLEGYRAAYGDRSFVRTYAPGLMGRDGSHAFSQHFTGHPEDWFFNAKDHDLVVLMSDGVLSFQHMVETDTSRTLEKVPVERVVEQVLDVKGTKGRFMQRRCQKFLTRFCERERWQHADDFSAAAVWMDGPEKVL